jgi:hypothetical protein
MIRLTILYVEQSPSSATDHPNVQKLSFRVADDSLGANSQYTNTGSLPTKTI